MVSVIVFLIAGAIVLGGGLGVILNRNPVRAALSLIASFFGVAVLFVMQEAHFLAFVQVVVYAGAVVVLFLFVIMLLGVDKTEDLDVEPLAGQRWTGILLGALTFGLVMGGLFLSGPGFGLDSDKQGGAIALTGQETQTRPVRVDPSTIVEGERAPADVDGLAADLFGRNVLAFEATALLLTIATVAAVVLVKNKGAESSLLDEPGTAAGRGTPRTRNDEDQADADVDDDPFDDDDLFDDDEAQYVDDDAHAQDHSHGKDVRAGE